MVVTNLAGSDFSFQHGTVSLAALPSGLSLAPTTTPQTLDHVLPDIPGGQSTETSWVLRGDTENFYTLAAQYSGSLEPSGVPIHLSASTAPNALHVWGGSALHLIVDADTSAAVGSPYRIRVGMQNVADVPMFNPSHGPCSFAFADGPLADMHTGPNYQDVASCFLPQFTDLPRRPSSSVASAVGAIAYAYGNGDGRGDQPEEAVSSALGVRERRFFCADAGGSGRDDRQNLRRAVTAPTPVTRAPGATWVSGSD